MVVEFHTAPKKKKLFVEPDRVTPTRLAAGFEHIAFFTFDLVARKTVEEQINKRSADGCANQRVRADNQKVTARRLPEPPLMSALSS